MKKIFSILPLIIFSSTIIFFQSCNKDEDPVTPPTERPVYEGSGAVGSGGAIVQITAQNSSIKGAYVDIPAGALSGNVTVSVSQAPSNIKAPNDTTALVIQFEPKGLRFNSDVKIGLPYNPTNHDPNKIKAYYYDPDSAIVRELIIESIDTNNKLVIAYTSHFSKFYAAFSDVGAEIEMFKINGKFAAKIRIFGDIDEQLSNTIYGIPTLPTILFPLHFLYPDVGTVLENYNNYDAIVGINAALYEDNIWPLPSTKRDECYLLMNRLDYSYPLQQRVNIKKHNLNTGQSQTLYTYPVNSWERLTTYTEIDQWYSGKTLIFRFENWTPSASKNYYIAINFALASNPNLGYPLGGRITELYALNNSSGKKKISDVLDFTYDTDNNYVDDRYQTPNQAPNEPINPTPSLNALNQTINVDLSWECSDPDNDPLTYDIYFGSSTNPPLVKSNNSTTTYDPGTLNFNSTYAWKIIAKDNHSNSTSSQSWSFTTEKGPIPVVTTTAITNITSNSATGGGSVTNQGTPVASRGVCWSTSQNPTISNNYTNDGSGTGSFTSSITGLNPSTAYYVRAYAGNQAGIAYGNQVSFTTSAATGTPPTVTTSSISNITSITATSGGNVTSQGSSTVTARGVCWNTSQNPTIDNDKTIDGTGTGSFTSNITGLTASTTYYVRAYATNSAGTSYGSQISFTTSAGTQTPPTVTTLSISNITSSTATGGGEVTAQGSSTVTARGVCWSTSQNPTTSNSKTTDGTGTGSFTSLITGLNPSTPYYVRAYATNSAGTSYGNEVNFTTSSGGGGGEPCPGIPTVLYGGITYNTVLIGTQCWLKENLNVGIRIDGSQEQINNTPTNIIEKYCYNDVESNCTDFGGLYRWTEAMRYDTIEGAQGICPPGWHIPTWVEFESFGYAVGWDGNSLKAIGQGADEGAGTNTTGFSALLAGQYAYGFASLGEVTSLWSSKKYGTYGFIGLGLLNYNNLIYSGIDYGNVGVSVRCIKD